MDIHKNARLTPHSRAELARRVLAERQTPKAVATALGVCERTVRKWVRRFPTEDGAGPPGGLFPPPPPASRSLAAAQLGRLEVDPRGEIPEHFHALRSRLVWGSSIAGAMALIALYAGTWMKG